MQHGGKRKGAGRKKGVPNKVTAEARALIQSEVRAAIEGIKHLAHNSENENVQFRSLKEILQYGMGRPGRMDGPEQPTVHVVRRYRWARNEAEATFDPSRARLGNANTDSEG